MKIGILGTGMVGRAHAAKLAALGHDVIVGTRSVQKTLARDKKDEMGQPPFRSWQKKHAGVKLGTFAQAARHGQVIINAMDGLATIRVIKAIGPGPFAGKVVLDVANALRQADGEPTKLAIPTTDSLAERIQRALPRAKVVKALSNVDFELHVNPRLLARGDHDVFVSGNDAGAKRTVTRMLKDWYGWKRVIDLGDLTTARGQESLIMTWIDLWGALGTAKFGLKVVKQE